MITQQGDAFQFVISNHALVVLGLYILGAVCIFTMVARGDFMTKIIGVGLLILAIHFLSGCAAPDLSDPLGATSREQIRANAQATIAANGSQGLTAQAQADERARIAAAQADANAKVAVANSELAARVTESNNKITVTQIEQDGATTRTKAWSSAIPLALIIIGLGVVTVIVVNWQGRIAFAKTKLLLPPDKLKLLKDYATESGKELEFKDGQYYLTGWDGSTKLVKLKR